MDILGLAGADHADRIDDEAKRDAIGDGIAQHHDDDGHKGSGSDHHIFPVDRLQLLRHHDADHDQGRGSDRIGDRAQDQRRDQDGEQEEHAGRHSGQARASADPDTRAGLNERSDRGRTDSGTEHRTDGIGQQRAFRVLQLTGLRIDQADLTADGHQRARRIKEIDEQEREDHYQALGRICEQLAESVHERAGAFHMEIGGDE